MAERVVIPRNFKLIEELESAEKDPQGGISLGLPTYDDIYMHKWTATIVGPMGTAFENRIYSVHLYCDSNYPNSAPNISFETKVNMSSVNSKGEVLTGKLPCLQNWKSSLSMMDALLSLRSEMFRTDKRTAQPAEGTGY